ncbi:hypothetical protein EIL26_28065 [Salmonella enterica subsp. enterica serovar Newport]|uniref:Uncharacterized protein n=1 Tax=Salmonella enterica I TaxID=59201 RepID=A0A7Z1TE07_SALET|nr:hypothetical protein [Salmonella enterica]ECA0405662.1 hypothetical protein [Salmonella enterica subsp. enterica serovar Newport]PUF49692.1 hypothetical protein DAX73_28025 [Salmonella enterica subsp. enterica]
MKTITPTILKIKNINYQCIMNSHHKISSSKNLSHLMLFRYVFKINILIVKIDIFDLYTRL